MTGGVGKPIGTEVLGNKLIQYLIHFEFSDVNDAQRNQENVNLSEKL